jgi:hypothetical protein
MKIIKLNENNPYFEYIYDKLETILYFGYEYLPFIFLKKVYIEYEGFPHWINKKYYEELQLPRWITKRHMDSIDEGTQKLMNELNWE